MDKLAIEGGIPVREKYLPYGRQNIEDKDIEAVVEVLKSDFLTTGPMVAEFEKMLCEKTGAKYAVAMSNGTAALHAACYAAQIGVGDEVITSPMTFAASSNCILYQGGTPVFADINDITYNIDPNSVKEKLTLKTKAIIGVDFTGQPCEWERLFHLTREYKTILIEDASHSLGADYNGKRVGSIADMTTLSFHPVKHITTGEGGAVLTNSYEFYQRLILFRTHGITRNHTMMGNKENGAWYYEQIDLGYNYRITDIQCALGMSQLDRLEDMVARRRAIASIYNEAFKDDLYIKTPEQLSGCNSSWHLYVIRVVLDKLSATRNQIFNALVAENIGVNVHYIPVYLHPYYQSIGYDKTCCPNSEKLYSEILSLPIFPSMADEDVLDVIKAVKKVLNFYSK